MLMEGFLPVLHCPSRMVPLYGLCLAVFIRVSIPRALNTILFVRFFGSSLASDIYTKKRIRYLVNKIAETTLYLSCVSVVVRILVYLNLY